MTHESSPASAAAGDDLVEDRDRRLGALEPEALGADVLRGEELLERLGGVEALEDAALLRPCRTAGGRPRPWTGSSAAPRCPGCACTRCRSCGSRRRAARRAGRRARIFSVPATPPVRNSRSRSQIVNPYVSRVELLGHDRLLPAERVEVGDEVAADAVDADQRGDLHLLLQHRLFAVDRVDVGAPAAPPRTACRGRRRRRRRSRARRAAARAPASGTGRSRRPG